MNKQNLTHNVTPVVNIAPAIMKAGPSFGGKVIVWQACFTPAIKAAAGLWLCHYRMAKRAGRGLVGGFSY